MTWAAMVPGHDHNYDTLEYEPANTEGRPPLLRHPDRGHLPAEQLPQATGAYPESRTFDFPVVCSVVEDVDIPRLLFNPTPDLLQPFIDAARKLEREGVKAITGSCGFLARFQGEMAESVDCADVTVVVDVFMLSPGRMVSGEGVRW